LLGGGGSSGTTSTNTSSNVAPNTNTNTVSPVINYNVSAPIAPSVTQAPVQNQSASARSGSSSNSRSQTSNQFNPQFNPSMQFNPYLQFNPALQFSPALAQMQMQQQQMANPYGIPQPAPYGQPVQPAPPCNCPPAGQQQQQMPQPNQQLMNMLSDPRVMSTLTGMINSNLQAAQRAAGAREGIGEANDEDMAEFLPILGAIASAVVPTLIQAAPSIIQGVGNLFSGRRRRPARQASAQRYSPPPGHAQHPVQHTPPPPRPTPQPFQQAPPRPVQPQPVPMTQGANGAASGALSGLLSIIQNPQITAALGNLLNTGISGLTQVGQAQIPVSEAAFLNAISEYARMAEEELESLGTADNLDYMKDDSGQWKYDPNISTYRAEALVEAIHS
jgi:hypothetical protein